MGKETFLGKFMRGYFTWGLMIRSCKRKGEEGFANAFSSNLNTVNLKISPVMVGDTPENKSLPDYRIIE